MTVVDAVTGELVEPLDAREAEQLSTRIRLRLDTIADNYVAVLPLIRQAIDGEAHVALGYRSPGEYISARFGDALSKLGVEVRREVVRELTAAGLSTRAIAPVVGVSPRTVAYDVSGVQGCTPESDAASVPNSIVTTPDEGSEAAAEPQAETGGMNSPVQPAPRPAVTGIDGKTYSRPAPKPKVEVEYTDLDRAEDVARQLARNLSGLYALTNPERRAEYIATWRDGIRAVEPIGASYVTPEHMRAIADVLNTFASEWENANV